jgi:hypothetical protein
MQSPEENKAIASDKMTKADLQEALRESNAVNSDLIAQNALLAERARKGEALMNDAEAGVVEEFTPDKLEYVQFHNDYSFAGVPTANPKVWAHRRFFVRGGEVVLMPKRLVHRLAKDRGEMMNIGKDNLIARVIGKKALDDKGRPKLIEETISVDKLLKNVIEVGLPSIR